MHAADRGGADRRGPDPVLRGRDGRADSGAASSTAPSASTAHDAVDRARQRAAHGPGRYGPALGGPPRPERAPDDRGLHRLGGQRYARRDRDRLRARPLNRAGRGHDHRDRGRALGNRLRHRRAGRRRGGRHASGAHGLRGRHPPARRGSAGCQRLPRARRRLRLDLGLRSRGHSGLGRSRASRGPRHRDDHGADGRSLRDGGSHRHAPLHTAQPRRGCRHVSLPAEPRDAALAPGDPIRPGGGFYFARAYGDFDDDGDTDIFYSPGDGSRNPLPPELFTNDGSHHWLPSRRGVGGHRRRWRPGCIRNGEFPGPVLPYERRHGLLPAGQNAHRRDRSSGDLYGRTG